MDGVAACAFAFLNLVHGNIFNQTLDDQLINQKNISDEKLLVKFNSFVFDEGTRRDDNGSAALRMPPRYYPPSRRHINIKVLDLMKQSIYATQDRLMALEPVMEKYSNDPAFRMAFIFNRLNQLIIDIRRVYTVAYKQREPKKTYEAVIWYSNCVRKYVDILYIVEHTIELHTAFENMLLDDKLATK